MGIRKAYKNEKRFLTYESIFNTKMYQYKKVIKNRKILIIPSTQETAIKLCFKRFI